MEAQSPPKSVWSTFKNAYLRRRNLRSFWNKLDKSNLSEELINTINLFLKSESYNWTSKFWRHLIIKHLRFLSDKSASKNYQNKISQEYYGFTFFNESMIKEACEKIKENKIELNANIFKKHEDFSITESINYNLILLILYENIKSKNVFKYYDKIEKSFYTKYNPSLIINNKVITQHLLYSLSEFEKIEKLISKTNSKEYNFLEVGSGSGRTAHAILSLLNNSKYVIADLPPAINFCMNNLRNSFPQKKITTAFEIEDSRRLIETFNKNDILFIFPHQINFFKEKTFDISLALGCLQEMDKKIIKKYMLLFQNVSKFLYFKAWEYSALPYSFYKYYSVHNREDYCIEKHWKERFKERSIIPSNSFELGYEF